MDGAQIALRSLILLNIQIQPVTKSDITLIAQLQGSSAFSIYCTSNLDATGSCNRTDNNETISCEMIPGGIINCKEQGEPPIQCVIYSGVIGTQAYFYCTHRTDPGIRDNRINKQRFTPTNAKNQQGSEANAEAPTTLSDVLEKTQLPASSFSDPIQDSFN